MARIVEKISFKALAETMLFEILSPPKPNMRAIFDIYDLTTSCFVLYAQFLDNLETFSKEIYLVSWIFEKYVCIPN